MGIINRFLLLLLSLTAAALALAVIGAAAGWLPETVWLEELRYALTRKETLAGAGIAFLISLKLLGQVFARSKEKATSKGEYVIASGPDGEVRVALDAIRNFVDRLAREVHGVYDVRVKVQAKNHKEGATLAVALALTAGRQADIPKLSAQLAQHIQQQLAQTMELPEVPVDIVVADIADRQPARKHRVV